MNYMSNIPIIILNRDRLTYLERVVGQFLLLGYDNLFVLDMDSSYPPLIEYYSSCKDFTLIMENNIGHKGLWEKGILRNLFRDHEWIAVTDSDISLSLDTPVGFIEQMIVVAKDFRVDKVGLAITYDDITNLVLKEIIDPIESQYWKQPLAHSLHQCYLAPSDTTMCIVRPKLPFTYQGIRLADWPIKHLDWYSGWDNLTEEEQYYMTHADPSIATTVNHYNQWLNRKD